MNLAVWSGFTLHVWRSLSLDTLGTFQDEMEVPKKFCVHKQFCGIDLDEYFVTYETKPYLGTYGNDLDLPLKSGLVRRSNNMWKYIKNRF